jgi:hypothetical protein
MTLIQTDQVTWHQTKISSSGLSSRSSFIGQHAMLVEEENRAECIEIVDMNSMVNDHHVSLVGGMGANRQGSYTVALKTRTKVGTASQQNQQEETLVWMYKPE